jgi:purine-binding chemotaxis protein CheW
VPDPVPGPGATNVLTVGVAGEALALPAGAVREVLRPAPLTRVPHAPASLLGLCNLRGTVLPVLSLARLMGQERSAPSPAARVVVVEEGTSIGLLVDSVAAFGQGGTGRTIDLPALLARDFGTLARAPRRALAPAAARPESGAEEATENRQALVSFEIAGQDYALPLDQVAEVTRLPAGVTALPRTGDAMLGVIAHRGGLLPLVSLHALLGLPARPAATERARIVVIHLGQNQVGLVVDAMRAIRQVPASALDPVPPVLSRGLGEAQVEAIARLDEGRRLVSVLSPTRLFDEETAARLVGAMAGAGKKETDMTEARTGEAERFVVFRLGEEHYGLPIAAVDEVVRRPETLTRIPRAPEFVEGAMNLRGAVIPVIDQRRRFGSEGPQAGGRIVVVTIDGLRAGFAVDAVSEVLPIPAADLSPAPELVEGQTRIFDRVARVERGGRMILLIDPRALLDAAERDLLAAIAARAEGTAKPATRKTGKAKPES